MIFLKPQRRLLPLMLLVLMGCPVTWPSSETEMSSSPSGALAASMVARIDRVIAKVQQRQLRTDEHTPWTIMHAAIAFGADATVYDADAQEEVQAIQYLLKRAKYEGRPLFRIVDGLPTLPRERPVEHHVNQYLMMLALAGVTPDETLIADDGKNYTISTLIEAAKAGFNKTQEVGWTLAALSVYVPLDHRWRASNGRSYIIEDVLRVGIARDPLNEAEGGTHHLFGVAYAVWTYARTHETTEGVWQKAEEYLQKHIATIRRFQLDDGAFSVEFLAKATEPKSPSELVFSTGHTLEWLSLSLSEAELKAPWVEKGVRRLCEEIERHPIRVFSDGGIYHAVNSLRLYQEAVFGNGD